MKGEFDFIHYIKKSFGLAAIGDDCAVLPKDNKTDLVITVDMLIEDIDFRLAWTTPESLGHKALAISLSDIAAMGAEPRWAMLSLGIPANIWDSCFLDGFYQGWYSLAGHYGVELIGGDISRTSGKLVIDSIAGGEVDRGQAVMRSGAKEGDHIFVTGELGRAATGLHLLKNEKKLDTAEIDKEFDLIREHLTPYPQIFYGKSLGRRRIATSMIDISDGLSSDLRHLCQRSAVGARIYADKIPLDNNLGDILGSEDEGMSKALNGGEDFQLLFTANRKNISGYDKEIFTNIGEITSQVGIIELIRNGKTEILEPKGYQHF